MEKSVPLKGSRGAGKLGRERLTLLTANDGMMKPYKTPVLELLLNVFKPILLVTNITGIKNCSKSKTSIRERW